MLHLHNACLCNAAYRGFSYHVIASFCARQTKKGGDDRLVEGTLSLHVSGVMTSLYMSLSVVHAPSRLLFCGNVMTVFVEETPSPHALLDVRLRRGNAAEIPPCFVERTPSLHALSDVHLRKRGVAEISPQDMLACHGKNDKTYDARAIVLESPVTKSEGSDWVFGVRWTPELFVKEVIFGGASLSTFSDLPSQVRLACE